MNKRIVTLFLFGCMLVTSHTFSSTIHAQEQVITDNALPTRVFGLEQSIEYAKLNSPLSRAARYALLSAKWRFRSFRADLLPSISLTGDAPNVADVALFPFIRQFAGVDMAWWQETRYPCTRQWLARWVDSALFSTIMAKYPRWEPGQTGQRFPSEAPAT